MFKPINLTGLRRRLPSWEPFIVIRDYRSRDGPLIYHRRDGPRWHRFIGVELSSTGPPDGTGPPKGSSRFISALRSKEFIYLKAKSDLKNVMKFK